MWSFNFPKIVICRRIISCIKIIFEIVTLKQGLTKLAISPHGAVLEDHGVITSCKEGDLADYPALKF